MEKLRSAHFFALSSQGNVYTLCTLRLLNNTNKLLVASLRREVICFEYQENDAEILIPTSKEISFTYLPGGAEIISMTAFNKSEINNDFVIGITIIKNSNDLHALETYLNIYSGWEEGVDFNMESISQNCVNNIELKFIPYHLTHTFLIIQDKSGIANKEVVFLLSGSDNKIHIYQENKVSHTYKEIDCKEYFPEFLKPPSIVIWMDIYYYKNFTERVTVFCCECGYIRLCRIYIKTNKILFSFSTRFDNIISMVRFYENNKKLECPDSVQLVGPKHSDETPILNLIVVNTVLPAVVFGDVLTYGLKKYGTLPRFELTSAFTCAEATDIDFDGSNEILIGNSNQEVILYKYENTRGWCIVEVKRFSTPIFGLRSVDITGDGVKEYNPKYVQQALEKKLRISTA